MSRPESPAQPKSAARVLFSTTHAAHAILGGTNTVGFWGFTFQEFVDRLQQAMLQHIGDPADAPWRRHIDYAADDYIELNSVLDTLDFVQDPADHLDLQTATRLARLCDVVGLHGGVNGIGVGKDTAATALTPHGFVALAFADVIKASMCR